MVARSACSNEIALTETVEQWSAEEAQRIVRIAHCMPEHMRADYIAQSMVEAIGELLAQSDRYDDRVLKG